MIDRQQIEQDVRTEFAGDSASPSENYIVYLNTTDGNYATANVIFEGKLDESIQSFLAQLTDEGGLVDNNYTLASISSIEEFDASKSDFS